MHPHRFTPSLPFITNNLVITKKIISEYTEQFLEPSIPSWIYPQLKGRCREHPMFREVTCFTTYHSKWKVRVSKVEKVELRGKKMVIQRIALLCIIPLFTNCEISWSGKLLCIYSRIMHLLQNNHRKERHYSLDFLTFV